MPTTIRRFTLLDALVLVAATAAGIAASREDWIRLWELDRAEKYREYGTFWIVASAVIDVFDAAMLCLVAWTFSLLLLRLGRPRPRFSRLILQPGMAASAAATMALLVILYFDTQNHIIVSIINISYAIGDWSDWWLLSQNAIEKSTSTTATAVLVAWAMLGCSRLGRCEPSWIDRAGRILGILWILFLLINSLDTTLDFLGTDFG